eukprot:TRINITY_DN5198_c0_g1_i2.p1 TRINITY_DN5198_c0_g1~~TRINITY_DN5198_c0_g1_i2.p1  ORF type:complete len:595 (-),score=183.73 TRINITY_DN5198_c0_g1_i2:21-1805(-)
MFFLVPFCFVASNFVAFIIKEKQSKAKHLQVTCGVNLLSYWAANVVWDMLNFVIIVILSMIVFSIFGNKQFVGTADRFFATAFLFFFFAFSAQCIAYSLSFIFDNPTSALLGIAGIINVVGFALILMDFILNSILNTIEINKSLKKLYRIFPPYNLGEGITTLASTTSQVNAFSWEIVGRSIFLMFIEGFILLVFTLSIDLGWISFAKDELRKGCKQFYHFLLGKLSKLQEGGEMKDFSSAVVVEFFGSQMDEDVLKEKKKVEEIMEKRQKGDYQIGQNEKILIHNLRKVFPSNGKVPEKVAVDSLNLIVPKGECFGFLGVNGAGKTTTLSMLTHDIEPTSGSALISGFDVLSEYKQMSSLVGYCPQFDPLLDKLTGKEHLRLFGRLKGIPEEKLEKACDQLLLHTGMKRWGDNLTETYSGGTKRKLSLAIALIGCPEVVFLDEPSSGMDPVARRYMWNVIKAASKTKSISLTTHSMEECEALCTRVGIMVGGKLHCLGAVQHLKSKFGKGYLLEIKSSSNHAWGVKEFIVEHFEGAILSEEHQERVKYSLPKSSVSLGEIFSKIEMERQNLGIVDYSVSQTTLEEVFINVTKK